MNEYKNRHDLTPREAGEILGITRQQILRYIQKGHLPSIQFIPRGLHHIKYADVITLKERKS